MSADTSSLLHTISTTTRGEEKPVAAATTTTADHTAATTTTTAATGGDGVGVVAVASLRDRVHSIMKTWSNQRINAVLVIVCGQIENKSSLISKQGGTYR